MAAVKKRPPVMPFKPVTRKNPPPVTDPFTVPAEPTDGPVEVTPAGLDPDHLMLADVDASVRPLFSIREVGVFFFNETDYWLRIIGDTDKFTYNGKKIKIRRTPAGARVYSLADIELIAHGLAQNRVISGQHAVLVLQAVAAFAKIHGLLDASAD